MKKSLLSIICLISVLGVMQSCTKDNDSCSSTNISDQTIARLANSSDGLTCLASSSTSLQTVSSFRIKMNSVASKAINNGLQASFPNNSMLVREALDQNGNVTGSDIMYRSESDPHSSNGWLWLSTDANGNVIYNASEKGAKCQSCHNGSVSSLNGM